MLPLPELERINLVDTPGLNSLLPEHEQTAREFIDRADAIVWVFSANQAATKSEASALATMHQRGKRVLGVLNKVDQLTAVEISELTRYIETQLGNTLETVVPASAKRAREFQGLPKEKATADDGNWHQVIHALETRFFQRARALKHHECDRRFVELLDRATQVVNGQREAALTTTELLRTAAGNLRTSRNSFLQKSVVTIRGQLNRALTELYQQAAEEILDLVRPRQLPFGSHQTALADRDYLISLLDAGYENALFTSRQSVSEALRIHGHVATREVRSAANVLGADAATDMQRSAQDAIALVEAKVFDRVLSYLQGYLRGGYMDTFFRRTLAKIELSKEAIYHALVRDTPNVDDIIAAPLATSGAAAMNTLIERLEHWAGVANVLVHDIDEGIGKALYTLHRYREDLANTTGGG